MGRQAPGERRPHLPDRWRLASCTHRAAAGASESGRSEHLDEDHRDAVGHAVRTAIGRSHRAATTHTAGGRRKLGRRSAGACGHQCRRSRGGSESREAGGDAGPDGRTRPARSPGGRAGCRAGGRERGGDRGREAPSERQTKRRRRSARPRERRRLPQARRRWTCRCRRHHRCRGAR